MKKKPQPKSKKAANRAPKQATKPKKLARPPSKSRPMPKPQAKPKPKAKLKARPAPAKAKSLAPKKVKALAPKLKLVPKPGATGRGTSLKSSSRSAAPQRPEPRPPKIVIAPAAERVGLARPVSLPPDYRPTEKEPFMNSKQLEYFRRKLHQWRVELLKESEVTLESLQEGGLQEADLADRASAEMERALELRTRDRARKLISKIDSALQRIEDGSYGFCEETGEPITLKRLEARPIATLSIEAQERHERMERTHRSD